MKENRSIKAAVGVLLMLILSAMYAWSYFKVALGNAYPIWTQKQITLNFTILMSCFCLGGLAAGSVMKKLSKTLQLFISAILMGIGFFGVSLLPQNPYSALIQLYVCYGVLTGFGTGIAYNAVLSGIQPWFPDKPGFIAGVLLMGMGFGTLILGNLAAALIPVVSLAITFRIFAIAALVILCICAPVVRVPDGNVSMKRTQNAPSIASSSKDFATSEMLKRPTFWLYFIWNIMMSAGGMLVINSASSISLFYGLAAVVGLVVSVFNGFGRLIIGTCMDRLGWKGTMFLNNGVLLVSGVLLCIGDKLSSGFIVLVGMLCMGICYGGGITISAALIRQLYGSKYYASNFSVCNLCLIPASIIGPMISAALQDGTGTYWTTFVMVVIMGIITLALNFTIRKP